MEAGGLPTLVEGRRDMDSEVSLLFQSILACVRKLKELTPNQLIVVIMNCMVRLSIAK